MTMDLSEQPITLRDGSPGVSWLTPTTHRGRILTGVYDVNIRPLTLSEQTEQQPEEEEFDI